MGTLSRNAHSPLLNLAHKTEFQRGIYPPIFIAALFAIAEMWKLPNYPRTDEGINKI